MTIITHTGNTFSVRGNPLEPHMHLVSRHLTLPATPKGTFPFSHKDGHLSNHDTPPTSTRDRVNRRQVTYTHFCVSRMRLQDGTGHSGLVQDLAWTRTSCRTFLQGWQPLSRLGQLLRCSRCSRMALQFLFSQPGQPEVCTSSFKWCSSFTLRVEAGIGGHGEGGDEKAVGNNIGV